ncbi:unnamed protein product [Malus baccata var. baccata]
MIPFWNFNYCKIHESNGTPRCNTCDRLKTTGQNEYVNLGNNRQLCSGCFSTAILHPSKCKRLFEIVHKFYKKLGLEVDKEIPILLVDDDEMGRIHPDEQVISLTKIISIYADYVWVVTDFKMFKERCVEFRSSYRLGCPHHLLLLVCLYWQCCLLDSHRLLCFLLLGGCVRRGVMIGSTLAHKLMHAWLALQGFGVIQHQARAGCYFRKTCKSMQHTKQKSMWTKIIVKDLERLTWRYVNLDSEKP